ncbi:DUF2318 domain-containing protein [Propionimicrobium lymphophilum]|uniref:DUF2318 domain-containing protein n=1 Tax=Propionimicrobium lymphophilum TaxID=33012 RepID=UPI000418B4BE|nr:DUF2318 domain-containing protein [Propionimicrobium lymphophilum]
MLKLFVAAVRLSMPLLLTIAILLASRAHAPMERRTVSRITWAVTVLSLAAGAVLAQLRINTTLINIPTMNTIVGIPAIISAIVFLVAVWMFGNRDLHDIEQTGRHRFLTISALVTLAFNSVFLGFPYFFGTDGVVLMGSSLFESESLLRLAGFVLGTLLVLVACWCYVKSARRVPWVVRTVITVVVFLAIIGPRAVLLYQQLSTRGMLPKSNLIFDMVLWIQYNGPITQLVLAVLIGVPSLIALWTHPRGPVANPALGRIRKADMISRRKFFALSLVLSILFGVTLTLGHAKAEAKPELSPIEPSVIQDDKVLVDRATVSDGHLHRFAITTRAGKEYPGKAGGIYKTQGGVEVRFIVIMKNETAFGTGLDACEICGDSGYYESDGKVICEKCNVMMNIQTIGFPGGCNPIPISYEVVGDNLQFSLDELESQENVFR